MITAQNFNGFLAFVFFAAIPVAAVLGILIRARYRKAVSLAMMADTGSPEAHFEVPAPTAPNHSKAEFEVSLAAQRPPLRPWLALRYFLSGLAFSISMVVVMFILDDIDFLPVRFTVVVASFAFPALVMAFYVAGLRWYIILFLSIFWIWLLFLIAPESNGVIAMLVGPALVLALVVGNPFLRTTAIPLFLVAVALVVPMVFALDVLYAIMAWGVLDFLIFMIPPELISVIYVILALVVVLLIGGACAALAVQLVARATADSSEFMMQHDLLWLFQTIWIVGLGWSSNGPLVLLYFLSFAAYRLMLWALRRRNDATEISLLLRVFGQQKQQTNLARGFLLDWRRDGPILLIGAADLATETLDAPELAAFLHGRLKDIFIETPEDLSRASAIGEKRLGDGLFPMQDYYCRDNTWRPTVLTLMSRARRVLVDMRGFEKSNKGIQFEIRALAERVPAKQIILLVEQQSLKDVQAVFADIWSQVKSAGGTDRIAIMVDNRK